MNTRQPLYVLPGGAPGLLVRGTININNRPPVKYGGGIATVRSTSFEVNVDGRKAEVLIPTVVQGKVVSGPQAYRYYVKTGQHLGIFDSIAHANAYGKRLHIYHAQMYGKKFR